MFTAPRSLPLQVGEASLVTMATSQDSCQPESSSLESTLSTPRVTLSRMQQLQVQPTRDQRLQMISLMMTLLFVFLAAADIVQAAAAVAPGRRVQSKTAATVAVPVAVTATAASCTDELGEGNCVRYTRGGLQTMCSHVPDHSDEWGFDLRNYTYVGGKRFAEYCPKTCKRCSANDPDAARAAITALCGHGNEVRVTAVNNGSYRDNNATACTPCAAGTIDHDTNSSTPCTICGAGTFSEASSTACSVCTCAAGTYGTNSSGSQNKSLPQSADIEVRRQTQICLSPRLMGICLVQVGRCRCPGWARTYAP